MSRPESRPYSKGGGFERASKSRRGQRGYYSEVVSKSAARSAGVSHDVRNLQATVGRTHVSLFL